MSGGATENFIPPEDPELICAPHAVLKTADFLAYCKRNAPGIPYQVLIVFSCTADKLPVDVVI